MKLETIVAVLSLLGTATARTRLRLVKVDDVEYDWDYSIRGSVDSEVYCNLSYSDLETRLQFIDLIKN